MSETTFDAATYIPQRALVVVAHPDDVEFSVAGTIARWTRAGASVCYVLCTDGDAGLVEPGSTRQQAADIRRVEQTAAAKQLGVEEVVFLGKPDGLLVNDLDLRRHVVRQIRRFQPDTLVTGDPTIVFANNRYINHPDHRAAAQAALDAVFPAAGMPIVFSELEAEGLTAHRVAHIYISGWGADTDILVDISETIDLKICALKEHKSQVGDNPEIDERIRQGARERGQDAGIPYAEGFRVINLPWANEEKAHVPIQANGVEAPCESVEGHGEPVVIRLVEEA